VEGTNELGARHSRPWRHAAIQSHHKRLPTRGVRTGLERISRGSRVVSLSVVVPVYNEHENIPILYTGIIDALTAFETDFEIILVDDGSSDGTDMAMKELTARDRRVKVIQFRRNFGQAAALAAGIRHASKDIVVTLDADLQNDPSDIPMVVRALADRYDVVCGWRHQRADPFVARTMPSLIANKIIAWATNASVHDMGCSLRAYRRDIVQEISLYGEMHRFLPALINWIGGRVGEVKVAHHPRKYGTSKYGLQRTLKVILDLITVKFLRDFSTKPNYVFGGFGLIALLLSGVCFLVVAYRTFALGNPSATPMVFFMVIFFVVGFLSIFVGLLAELVISAAFESQKRVPYHIKNTINLNTESRAAWRR
jgi:glycosyltransferase involved in cell wall biosynthesis